MPYYKPNLPVKNITAVIVALGGPDHGKRGVLETPMTSADLDGDEEYSVTLRGHDEVGAKSTTKQFLGCDLDIDIDELDGNYRAFKVAMDTCWGAGIA
jgi:hypothetical protein